MLAPALVRPQSQCLDMTGCLRPHLAAAHPQLQYRPQGCRAVPHGPAVCVSGGDPGSLPHRRLRSIVEGVLVRNAVCLGSLSLLPSAVWVGGGASAPNACLSSCTICCPMLCFCLQLVECQRQPAGELSSGASQGGGQPLRQLPHAHVCHRQHGGQCDSSP